MLPFRQGLTVLSTFLAVSAAGCSDSSQPGPDPGLGRITFTRAGNNLVDIYAMDLRGTNLQQLTTSFASDDWAAWSPDTTRIVFQSDLVRDSTVPVHLHIYIMYSDGTNRNQLTFGDSVDSYQPGWSPDATKIVFGSNPDSNLDIYTMDPNGANIVRLTTDPAADAEPAWSPDGGTIAFATERDGNAEIYVMNPDGTNPVNLTNDPNIDLLPAWSPDGSKIAFQSSRSANFAIWVMNADGSNPVRLTGDNPPAGAPSWSPDGTRIAYVQDGDIWVMNADGSNKIQVTSGFWSDDLPRWRPIL